ncbi:MAG: branched-chain amino acid ABC transporter permease [Bauldia sp.]|nr:branched-chain amino acid ABC transporter permease [Bauldia sp.]
MIRRALILYALFFGLVLIVGWTMGAPFTARLLVETAAYALIALGLNIQWGYGGLFNFGILGLVMLGGFAVTAMAMPVSTAFWGSDGPWLIGRAIIAAGIGALLIIGAGRLDRIGFSRGWKRTFQVLAWIVAYIGFRTQIDPAVESIESSVRWIGGLGLPSWVGWIFGGVLAAGVAWLIGKVTLGLRSDYLAIATIGIAEIIRALIKNMEWLTRGTLTVSPVPWPVPLPQAYQADGISVTDSFVYARAGYLILVVAVLVAALLLVQRAYAGPWGRMMRAIRDNYIAAGAMGKDVRARQLQLFVLGSALIGIGGAMLTSFTQIYDPSGYQTIDHTFLIWVMVIVGGAGNNFGAVFGGMLIYLVWVMSEPVSQWLFTRLSDWFVSLGWAPIPEIASRALQMRVFVLGLVIVLALRYAPRGLIPEVTGRTRLDEKPTTKTESPDPA